MADYIPTADIDLLTFANTFTAQAGAKKVLLGLPATADAEVGNLTDGFSDALNEHNAAQTAARVKRSLKDDARAELVAKLRQVTKQIQAHPATTNAVRADFGITIADSVPSYVPAPSTRPALIIGTGDRLKHTIQFSDEATPLSRAKPYGAMGMELYRKIGGAAPVGVGEMEFVALDTATPYVADYAATDAGKTIYYQGCWVNRSGERSPFSQVVQATLVG